MLYKALQSSIIKLILATITQIAWACFLIGGTILLIYGPIQTFNVFVLIGTTILFFKLSVLILFDQPLRVVPDWTLIYPELVGMYSTEEKPSRQRSFYCPPLLPIVNMVPWLSSNRVGKIFLTILSKGFQLSQIFILIGIGAFVLKASQNFSFYFFFSGVFIYCLLLLMSEQRSRQYFWEDVYPELDNKSSEIVDKIHIKLKDSEFANIEQMTDAEWDEKVLRIKYELSNMVQEFSILRKFKNK